jgi:hypothetical protein
MLRLVLIGAIFVAVIFVIIRTALGTPGMRQMVEGFQSKLTVAPSTLNTVTDCPVGTQLFMYNGAAYCCNGQVNPDADDINLTCKPLLSRNFNLTFCTLGPPQGAVPNCMELRAGQMMAKGEEYCTTALPNYVEPTPGAGRCCASMANAAFTDCVDTTAANSFCDMTTATDISTVPGSCQFLRLKDEVAGLCPKGYSLITMQGTGDLANKTLAGCSDGNRTCFPKPMIDSLVAGGNDVKTLTSCDSSGGAAAADQP